MPSRPKERLETITWQDESAEPPYRVYIKLGIQLICGLTRASGNKHPVELLGLMGGKLRINVVRDVFRNNGPALIFLNTQNQRRTGHSGVSKQ